MSSMSHRCGMLAGLAIVALAATAPTASAETDQQLREDVATREQRSDLIGAHEVIRRIRQPETADREHAQHLMGTLQTLNTADSLRNSGDATAAARLLDAQIVKLEPIEDRFLIVALSRASKRAADAGRADADAGAKATLAKADALGNDGQWAKAAAVYKSVATQPQGEISGEIRRRGMVGQLTAESEVAEREPGEILRSVFDTLITMLRWGVYAALPFLVLLVILGCGRLLRWFPKSGRTTIALTEVVETDNRSADHDRALSQAMREALLDARLVTGVADRRDLDGTAVPLLRNETFTVDTEPAVVDGQVTIGPVGVNLGQLLRALRRKLMRPGDTELTGSVRSDDSGVHIALQAHSRGKPLGQWSATEPTRGEAIRAVARQYVIQSAQPRHTTSVPSHRAYCEAVEKLDGHAGEDALVAARVALERSLAHDDKHLPARLRLGGVLRLLGDNAESAYQLRLLLDDLQAEDELPEHARAFVTENPGLEYVARYERGVALAKVGDRQQDARAELAQLVEDLGRERDDPNVQSLYPLAMAAWGAAHLPLGTNQRSREVVLKHLDWIATRLDETGGGGGRSEARGVLENARARVLFRLGDFGAAREAAEQALAAVPDLTDARITLACVHMKTRDVHGEWIEPTRRLLERAEAVSPGDTRLLYRLGRFYDLLDDDVLAKQYYGRLPHDWKALDRLADVLYAEASYEEALKLRVRADRIRRASGDRADALIDTFLHAARARKDDIDAVVACAKANTPAGDALAKQRLGEVTGHAEQLRGTGRSGTGAAREALVIPA